MRILTVLSLLLTFGTPLQADVPDTVTRHILPGYAQFAKAADALADQAQMTCEADVLRPAFHAAFDAWMSVQHLRFGPVEEDGRGLAIAFWPDPKASGARAQLVLLNGDPAKLSPAAFADQSIAARGLMGLERLLYPADPLPADPCPLIRATATDLARLAAEVNAGWTAGFADVLLTAGQGGNTRYLSALEARQAVFTQLATGLEALKDQRLGRPMGTADRPAPDRAEARASGRSLRNVELALQSMRQMTETLSADAPQTLAAFDRAVELAQRLNDPVFAAIGTPQGRLKVEILQQAIARIRELALTELGPELGVNVGFNAQDGD